jgi:uroporphyrinogen III methyltransferase/synthase
LTGAEPDKTEQGEGGDASRGLVSLVGAGPGEPGLITRMGLDRLRAADVVVCDALADRRLLEETPEAEFIDVGKRARQHKLTQDQINALLIERGRQGQRVVRLKGGDPYLFGRGAEEIAAVAEAGLRCEMIPGITAGVAGPALAGIPVTHRDCASTVTFITGHEDPTKPDSAVDYQALAGLAQRGGTLGFYMGVGRLPTISAALLEHGLSEQTPAAIVQWGTLPRQRTVRGTLSDIAERASEAGVGAPAIVVVGQVAGLDQPGLDFFTNRALFGKRIVITRTRQQASSLRQQLEAHGADVLEAPTIELAAPTSWQPVDEALAGLDQYDWLVLTSANGVHALKARLQAAGRDARALAAVKLAAIGDATARALREELAIEADLVPTRFVAESLASELIARESIAGQHFLLLRADIARPALPATLREAGATVDDVTAYQTQQSAALPDSVIEALQKGEVDWLTFTSSSTVKNMAALLGEQAQPLMQQVKIASIGPITSETIRQQGWPIAVEASTSNIPGLVSAIVNASKAAAP